MAMPQPYRSPGVYRQELFLKAPPVLQTGVPGFAGFAGPPVNGGLGNTTLIPAPTTPPQVEVDVKGTNLPAGTYSTKITYFDTSGETIASPATASTLTTGGSLLVRPPADQPAQAAGYKIYAGLNQGLETLQGTVHGKPGAWTAFALRAPLAGGGFHRPVVLNRKEEFGAHFSGLAGSYLEAAVTGFFENGGSRCYVVAADPASEPVQALCDAIGALDALDDVDLLAVPDALTLKTFNNLPDEQGIGRVQEEALRHCAALGNRFAILDSLPGASVDDVSNQCRRLLFNQRQPVNGALYYPWVVPSTNPNPVPPCGHVAGIYARSDAKAGVFRAPANEEVFGVLDIETQIDNSLQDKLNPIRVNCLRAFPGRGIRVWGARTIGTPSENDPWLYVGVRRLFLTLDRWIGLNMAWASFEPNDARLWVRIQRELSGFLAKLQGAGALHASATADGFYVKCDAENNPPELRDSGQVVIEIGLAPLSPAEFVVVQIVRQAGNTPDN